MVMLATSYLQFPCKMGYGKQAEKVKKTDHQKEETTKLYLIKEFHGQVIHGYHASGKTSLLCATQIFV